MHLSALYLHNFRLYEEAKFEFSPKVNVIKGPNAIGKTSLLEAVYFLMTGRSFRTSQVKDLIRHGTSYFYLEASFVKHNVEQRLRVYYRPEERRIIYNSTPSPSLNSLLGILQGTILYPDDASIVKGGPAARRRLLDIQLAQSDPLYVHHLARYERAMKQRNHLLRAKSAAAIDSWEYEMAHAASYLIKQRAGAVVELNRSGETYYRTICGGNEGLRLAYKAHGAGDHSVTHTDALQELFRDQYRRHRSREMELGATLTGPHKDDVIITLGGCDARAFASEGQQRSCVAALRLAEWSRLNAVSQELPLMLIDDLGMSLDSGRRKHLIGHFDQLEQIFVTTTEETALLPEEHVVALRNVSFG